MPGPDDTTKTPVASSPPEMVPYSRLQEVIAVRDAKATELQTAQASLSKMQASLEQERNSVAVERANWQADSTLMRAGLLNDEARGVARYLHTSMPEASRPALNEWVTTWSTDPTKAPLALQPYLSQPATPAGTPSAAPAPAAPAPAAPAPAAPAIPAPPAATPPTNGAHVTPQSPSQVDPHAQAQRDLRDQFLSGAITPEEAQAKVDAAVPGLREAAKQGKTAWS